MHGDHIATARITTKAAGPKVWQALVSPSAIKQYMFGTSVISEWEEGSPIVWKGEWQGRAYEDKGQILELTPGRRLRYTHFSPLSGVPDKPENYHTITIELAPAGGGTEVTLSQDNNATEAAREHSEKNWSMMLAGLKEFVEG